MHTLREVSLWNNYRFFPSTIIHVGEFSGVWDVFDGQVGKIFLASIKKIWSVYSCFSRDVTDYANLVIHHVGVPRSEISHVNKYYIVTEAGSNMWYIAVSWGRSPKLTAIYHILLFYPVPLFSLCTKSLIAGAPSPLFVNAQNEIISTCWSWIAQLGIGDWEALRYRLNIWLRFVYVCCGLEFFSTSRCLNF